MSRPLTVANLSDPREAAFVAAVFALGGPQHATEAALQAGYGKTPDEAERAAAFLMGSARISRAIVGEIKARFDVAAAAAFNTLVEVCTNRSAPANARISAAQEILNRSSIGPIPSKSTSVGASEGIEDWIRQLDELKRAERAQVIDVEASAVCGDAGDEPG